MCNGICRILLDEMSIDVSRNGGNSKKAIVVKVKYAVTSGLNLKTVCI